MSAMNSWMNVLLPGRSGAGTCPRGAESITGRDRTWMLEAVGEDSKRSSGRAATGCRATRRERLLAVIGVILVVAAGLKNTGAGIDLIPRENFKNGAETLRAFSRIAESTRKSVVKLDVDGSTAAFGVVIDSSGLVLTKGSEIRKGKLTAWLAGGREVRAELVAVNEAEDVGLVRVFGTGLKPIEWASENPRVGEWVVTPGIETSPQAVGIISVPPRKIPHKRAFIGVELDFRSAGARIARIMEGLGAEKSGLKSGDVILTVNGVAVETSAELSDTLRKFREGEVVKLKVRRERAEFDAEVEMKVPAGERFGNNPDRQDRMNRLGSELSSRAEGFDLAIQHDTVLQAWQCGGPLVNLEGKAVGLNIARAGRIASYALPAGLAKQAAKELRERGGVTEKKVGGRK